MIKSNVSLQITHILFFSIRAQVLSWTLVTKNADKHNNAQHETLFELSHFPLFYYWNFLITFQEFFLLPNFLWQNFLFFNFFAVNFSLSLSFSPWFSINFFSNWNSFINLMQLFCFCKIVLQFFQSIFVELRTHKKKNRGSKSTCVWLLWATTEDYETVRNAEEEKKRRE